MRDLLSYLNNDADEDDVDPEAAAVLRETARYFAGELDPESARSGIFSEMAGRALAKLQPRVVVLTDLKDRKLKDRKTELASRWDNLILGGHPLCFTPPKGSRDELTWSEYVALLLLLYLRAETQERALLGKRWAPRLKVCVGPRCGRFMYDATVNRRRRTCSARCRVAMHRAEHGQGKKRRADD
ncbi:MAG TPA: CGNR zinc finger domain-containing protein [Candidatus Polarisedimenticolia bacterium]|nr:CGNR zinc finger domain-containing protein [Candidatus Polarisedimenticolia bacterium]